MSCRTAPSIHARRSAPRYPAVLSRKMPSAFSRSARLWPSSLLHRPSSERTYAATTWILLESRDGVAAADAGGGGGERFLSAYGALPYGRSAAGEDGVCRRRGSGGSTTGAATALASSRAGGRGPLRGPDDVDVVDEADTDLDMAVAEGAFSYGRNACTSDSSTDVNDDDDEPDEPDDSCSSSSTGGGAAGGAACGAACGAGGGAAAAGVGTAACGAA
ncbi:uncharacterized protein V1510DRAFT_417423 [Dipodascopsis tothii]|uniref:uncharacterized protein n=1 Tax=Dipodascopsis tothii TaxID=44089 RepID=UPI0034CE2306